MKKLGSIIIGIILSFLLLLPVSAKEKEDIKIYLFYGEGCPHCAAEKVYLEDLKKDNSNISVEYYEVWHDSLNNQLLENVKSNLDISATGVPITVIGDISIVGYGDMTSGKINRALKYYEENEYQDSVFQIKNGTYKKENHKENEFEKHENKTDEQLSADIPFIGKTNFKNYTVSTAAVVLGLVDGFNPCTLIILLFLIGLLLLFRNKRKMLFTGFLFLGFSSLIYLLIVLSEFNLVTSSTISLFFINLIAIAAIVCGLVNFYNYLRYDQNKKILKENGIVDNMYKLMKDKSFILIVLVSIVLAFLVNIIKFGGTSNYSYIYTQLLAFNDIGGISFFFHVLIFSIFFLLDDLIIFLGINKLFDLIGLYTKYNKYCRLVSGFILVAVAVLFFIKPECIMFQFN